MSTDDNQRESIGGPPPAGMLPSAAPAHRRNATMRRELLLKLPRLSFSTLVVSDQFLVDEDLGSLDLGADAILAPLEQLMGDGR